MTLFRRKNRNQSVISSLAVVQSWGVLDRLFRSPTLSREDVTLQISSQHPFLHLTTKLARLLIQFCLNPKIFKKNYDFATPQWMNLLGQFADLNSKLKARVTRRPLYYYCRLLYSSHLFEVTAIIPDTHCATSEDDAAFRMSALTLSRNWITCLWAAFLNLSNYRMFRLFNPARTETVRPLQYLITTDSIPTLPVP